MIETINKTYGFSPEDISELEGDVNYSNKKYLISDSSGKKFILKIYSDKDELKLAKEEQNILRKISESIDIEVPVAVPGLDGNIFTAMPEGEALLLRYIEGEFIARVSQDKDILIDFGRCIAKLHLGLSKQNNELIKARKHLWDLQFAHINFDKAKLISDSSLKKHVDYYFDRYFEILPELLKLRNSLIHGDLNDYNVLVSDDKVKGFIDFGDMCFSPLINEVAIAACYIMMGKPDPFESAGYLIQGFNEIIPLTRQELLILPDLITTRLCVSICNSAEKRHLGEDTEYVLISEKPAIELLSIWKETNPIDISNRFLSVCSLSPVECNQENKEMETRRDRIMSKALSLSYSSPIHMDRSLFQYMYDNKGNTYLDAYNNIPHVGHSHPHVARAIADQSRKLNTNTRYIYDSLINYGEKLLQYFPENLNKIFFVNSGSAASDLSVRLARNFTAKSQILVLEHGYHGNTSTGIDISHYKFDGKGGKGVPDNISKLPLPNAYMNSISGKEFAKDAIDITKSLISAGKTPAAFINEPISGCGGQVPLADDYISTFYPFLKESGILTISDEVQVGFGRLGNHFWGFEMHGSIPDIIILGKPMGNGHPVGAVVTSSEIADSFATGMEFFSSFGGNPVSCEAAKAVLEIIETEDLQQNAQNVGQYYLDCLNELAGQHKIIGDVRGSGLFIGVEFTHSNSRPATDIANKLKNKLKENYILTGTDGPFDNVLKSKPPLCFTMENVDRVINTMDNILKKV